jgi:hypothetical protein
MKIIGNAPDWATELFTTVCKDYNRGLPSEFYWKDRNRAYSTGVTNPHWRSFSMIMKNGKRKKVNYYGYIKVQAGTDVQDQKLVLLHELAHHVMGRSRRGRSVGHSIAFWKLAFELYDNYGVDMDYAIKREKNYKVKATEAYEYHIAAKGATA